MNHFRCGRVANRTHLHVCAGVLGWFVHCASLFLNLCESPAFPAESYVQTATLCSLSLKQQQSAVVVCCCS